MIKDRNGRVISKNSGPTNIQAWVYRTEFGRKLLKILIKPKLSEIAGKFMDSGLSVPLIKPFIRRNRIDMTQFANEKYSSFNAFFTRRIKPSARPVDMRRDALISPCDAKLSVYNIHSNSIFRIKNSAYSISDLLQNDDLAKRYEGGICMIFRLSVDDYHRYCYIDSGRKSKNRFISGELHTVNPVSLENYNIYKRNCREYTILHTENFGDAVQAEVGAMLVGRICNRHGACHIKKGEEKGKFEYGGSTIVLLLERDRVLIDDDILKNSAVGTETQVRYGERIGTANK